MNAGSEGLKLWRCLRKSFFSFVLGEQIAEGPLTLSIVVVVSTG